MKYRNFFKIIFPSLFLFNLCIQAQTKQDVINEINELFRKSYQPRISFDSVLKNSQKIIELSKSYNLAVYEIRAYALLGTNKSRNKEFGKSMRYYYKAKSLAKGNNDLQSYYGILQNIAANHLKTSYHDSALYYFKKLKSFYKDNNQLNSLHLVHMNIGNSYYYLNKLDSAIVYLKKSTKGFISSKQDIKAQSGIPSDRIVVNNLSKIGDIYLLKKEPSNAILYADSSLVLARKINFTPLIKQSYGIMAQAYKLMGDADKASSYFELENTIELPNISPKNAIAIQSRNATSSIQKNKNTQEILRNEYGKNTVYKSSLFLVLIIVFVLGIIIFAIFRKKKRIKQEFELVQKELNELKLKTNLLEKPSKIITLKSKALLKLDDILFIKADDKYVEYYLKDKVKPEIDRNTLKDVENNLPSNIFVRVHRSYIVNIYRIKIINSTKLMLDNGTWINLSRTYKESLKKVLVKEVNY